MLALDTSPELFVDRSADRSVERLVDMCYIQICRQVFWFAHPLVFAASARVPGAVLQELCSVERCSKGQIFVDTFVDTFVDRFADGFGCNSIWAMMLDGMAACGRLCFCAVLFSPCYTRPSGVHT